MELLLKKEVFDIVGAAIEVQKQLGTGFLESVYQESLEMECGLRDIPFQSQVPLVLHYKGQRLNKEFLADMVCYEQIIVELKALDHLSGKEEAQVLNYLRATGMRVGLLINFGVAPLQWKRFVL